MTFRKLVEEAKKLLERAGVSNGKIVLSKNPNYGEATSPIAFDIAKRENLNPVEVAEKIVEKICGGRGRIIESVEALSGYINFKVDWRAYAEEILKTILSEREVYGSSSIGIGKKVIVEHTSVNPNKALHIGHARNVCIGDTLVRLFRFLGYDVLALNYIDDSGTQMADVILGITELGYSAEPPNGVRHDEYFGDVVYVEVSKRIEEDKQLEEKRRQIARMIEERDEKYYHLNRELVLKVLGDQLKTCWRLGASNDILNLES
ncbi:MAG: arginine--tRNA ligase, partial [Nitrososphaerota archaeon]